MVSSCIIKVLLYQFGGRNVGVIMVCGHCKSEIDEGTKFCTQCGTALALVGEDEPEKPKSTTSPLFKSRTKSEVFVGAIILLSLIVQAIMIVRNDRFLNQTWPVYPTVCAVLTIIIFVKNEIYKLKRIIVSSLIAFGISPVPLWILMILFSRGEYEVAYYAFAGLIPICKIIIINMFFYYSVILVWLIGYTIMKKRNKTTK